MSTSIFLLKNEKFKIFFTQLIFYEKLLFETFCRRPIRSISKKSWRPIQETPCIFSSYYPQTKKYSGTILQRKLGITRKRYVCQRRVYFLEHGASFLGKFIRKTSNSTSSYFTWKHKRAWSIAIELRPEIY